MLIENETIEWIAESRAIPMDNQLWSKARQIARMDKEYKPQTAALISKRIYQMMGGNFKRKTIKKAKKK